MDSGEWGRDTLQQASPGACLPTTLSIGESAPQRPGGYPVLIVDDDEAIRETLTTLLEDAGYAVQVAATGVEALAILRATSRPMVVLLDLIMPEPNGRGVLLAIAADRRLARRHAFIILTAAADALLDQTQAEVMRFDERLTLDTVRKPFDIDVVVAAVERIERLHHAAHGARGPRSGNAPANAGN